MKMIVGLGNPGKEYVGTRHNAGFNVIDSLAEQLGIEVKKKKFGALMGTGQFNGKKLILVKPVRFMNCSGQVVATVAGFYKLDLEDMLVVSDEMAIEAGNIRVRAKGSAGGHNGLADIIEKLGTEQFNRLRVGIGQSGSRDTVSFVLTKPAPDERELIEEATAKAKQAVISWIEYGIDKTMNEFN